MLNYSDRVRELTTTTGTGSYSLAGETVGYSSFVDAIGNGNTCYYCCTDGVSWEIGIGTVSSSPDTLARTQILSSSNSNSAVSWSAGTKQIYVTVPAVLLNGLIEASGNATSISSSPHFQNVVSSGNYVSYQSGIFGGGIISSGTINSAATVGNQVLTTSAVGGVVTLGNSNGYINLYGNASYGGTQCHTNLTPNGTRDIGQLAARWNNYYGVSANLSSNLVSYASGIFGKDIVASGNVNVGALGSYGFIGSTASITFNGTGGRLAIYPGGGNGLQLKDQAGNVVIDISTANGCLIYPNTTFGSRAVFGNNVIGYASGIFQKEITSSGNLIVHGNQVNFSGLPTSDPGVYGRLYRFGSGVFMSLG